MAVKRILLIESGRFIGGVIQHLFAQQAQLVVAEASPGNVKELIHAVEVHRPDVVVIDDSLSDRFIGPLLEMACEKLHVVVVYTESNRVAIYKKQHIQVKNTSDLFAAL